MVITQEIGTRKDIDAFNVPSNMSANVVYHRYVYEIRTGMEGSIEMNPIEYKGESVLINREYMDVGEAYLFLYSGHRLVAIKRQDETIDFYYLG